MNQVATLAKEKMDLIQQIEQLEIQVKQLKQEMVNLHLKIMESII